MSIKSPSQFTQDEVNQWLVAIGMGSKVAGFRENSIDGTMLMTLTEQDLTNLLGLTTLQARKFQRSLQFSTQLAASASMHDERTKALELHNRELQKEVADLKAMVEALRDPIPQTAVATTTSKPSSSSQTMQPATATTANAKPYVSNTPSSKTPTTTYSTTTTTTTSPYPPTSPQYDPYAPQSAYGTAPPPKGGTGGKVVKGAAGGAAKGALLGVIGGAIAGKPGEGAAIGAAVGGTGGAMKGFGRRNRKQAYHY